MLNDISIAYFINNKRYILESKKYKNKNELIVIGEFFQILRDENIENITLKNLREWDNKKLLPAYRMTHGPIREKVRYYSREHIDIVREILRLKALGLEIPDIKKIIFDNIPECLIFLKRDNLNDEYIKDIISQYKDSNLENDGDVNIIGFILILISACNCYDEINNIFDREKFSNYIDDIAGKY